MKRRKKGRKIKVLWTFVDETKFTQQPNESCIFEFAQELSLKSIYSTRRREDEGRLRGRKREGALAALILASQT